MTTALRVIERPADGDPAFGADYWRNPEMWGVMWRTPDHDLPDRESWCIILPNGAGSWNTTQPSDLPIATHGRGNRAGPLWDVTGTPPKLTVKPSIDAGEYGWHGWITDGLMEP